MSNNILLSSSKIPVSLSGKTLVGRGWDAKIERSDRDPQWNRIAEAIEQSTWKKSGRGHTHSFELDREDLERLAKDLKDNIYIYEGQGDEETRGYVRAWKKDLDRILLSLHK